MIQPLVNQSFQPMPLVLSLFFALALWVAILDDGSGDGGPPDPLPPVETDV